MRSSLRARRQALPTGAAAPWRSRLSVHDRTRPSLVPPRVGEEQRFLKRPEGSQFGHDYGQVSVHTPETGMARSHHSAACPLFPKACPFGGACHTCPVRVQRKRQGSSSNSTPPAIVHHVLRSPGQPLDNQTRFFMEQRLGPRRWIRGDGHPRGASGIWRAQPMKMRSTVQGQRQPNTAAFSFPTARASLLQRNCACGGTPGLDGECAECRKKRLSQGRSDMKQAKLILGGHEDVYEREADRVAAAVVESLATGRAPGIGPLGSLRSEPDRLQRQEEEETEEPVAEEALAEAEEDLEEEETEEDAVGDESGRPKLEAGAVSSASRTLSVELPKGGGASLRPGLRNAMEQRLGHDFSRVRIHTDRRAADANRRLKAHAFTVGSDVYFNRGRFDPVSTGGLKLLAHELAHVVQQSQGLRKRRQQGRDGWSFQEGLQVQGGLQRYGQQARPSLQGFRRCDRKNQQTEE